MRGAASPALTTNRPVRGRILLNTTWFFFNIMANAARPGDGD